MVKFPLPKITREYRPELNGLRALAVILVLFYHLKFDWMKGGYLGVDVFLVISGYFISRNILYDLQEGIFTFYRFYTKRLRRLFPALIFTLLIVVVAGYFILSPFYLERLGKSTIFSAISVSNFFFWSESGYFDLDSGSKPLLHMWSLSLEEQFYLFWPLLLFLFHRFTRKYILLFVGLFIIGSVFLAEWYYSTDPSAVFYLIPFRMFEFLLGASCIWFERFFIKRSKWLLEILFLFGMGLIIFSAIAFDHFTRMPGLLSLIPCFGSVFIVFGGKAPIMSWALKNWFVELIGKSSYSIYLIHWPLIVFYRYWSLSTLPILTQIILGVLSIIFGILMWRFIETTFRYADFKKRKLDRVWLTVPTLIVVLCVMGGTIWNSSGAPSRFEGKIYMTQEEALEYREIYFEEYRAKGELLDGNTDKGHVMIMGNSHSIDLIFALRQNGFEGRITSLQSLGKCFIFGESFIENAKKLCTEKKETNLKDENWNKVNAIYLHDNWPDHDTQALRRMLNRIRKISDTPIFVFGPKMTFKEPVPEIVRSSHSIDPDWINKYAQKFYKERKMGINNILKHDFENPYFISNNIYFIDILSLQGTNKSELFEVISKNNLEFLYFDKSHFTKKGSKELGRRMKLQHPYLFDMDMMKEKYPLR